MKRAHLIKGAQYQQSFRVLPALGAEQAIPQADGTMICTVQSGP
jgi:hypothetical protein